MGIEIFISWIRQFSTFILDKMFTSFIWFSLFLWVIVILMRTFQSALHPLQRGLHDSQRRHQVPTCDCMWSWLGYLSGNQRNRKITIFGKSLAFLHGKIWGLIWWLISQGLEEGDFWLTCFSTCRFNGESCQPDQSVYLLPFIWNAFFNLETQHVRNISFTLSAWTAWYSLS